MQYMRAFFEYSRLWYSMDYCNFYFPLVMQCSTKSRDTVLFIWTDAMYILIRLKCAAIFLLQSRKLNPFVVLPRILKAERWKRYHETVSDSGTYKDQYLLFSSRVEWFLNKKHSAICAIVLRTLQYLPTITVLYLKIPYLR